MSQLGQVVGILNKLKDEYQISTPKKLKLIDAYLFYVLLTGIIQFAYCLLVGTFPFNSFLSGFISTVGCFILAGKNFFFIFLPKYFLFYV
jgi:oligosaccharyltransferase complex subunit epsilon